MPSPKALHSKNTPKWGTPEFVIELARQLMGEIHTDPATSDEFNAFVKALLIYTEHTNGLAPENTWPGNVFLNPPGGLVKEFWNKLCKSYVEDLETIKAFWVGFSVEQLCTLGEEKYHPLDFSTVILRKRLNFNQQVPVYASNTSTTIAGAKIIQGNSPSHGNYLTAIGCNTKLFDKLFSRYGRVYHGKYAVIPPVNIP